MLNCLQDQKRLIFKIWRLNDPTTTAKADFDQDIVLGFSALDLSLLVAGFPIISGWFNIMDFAGQCNGQIKVNFF